MQNVQMMFFSDRKDNVITLTLELPDAVPAHALTKVATLKILGQYPEAHSFTRLRTESNHIATECGGLPIGVDCVASGY